MGPNLRIYVDFDGTLVEPNVAIDLVEKFCVGGEAVAHEVDLALHSGKMTLREAWERQAALLPVERIGEMTAWATANVPLRQGAKEFLRTMEARGVPVFVVSGGLDFYIEAVLAREGLRLPFLSDRLTVNGGGHAEVLHPFGHPTCRLCGICKAQVVRSPRHAGELTVFIGDGSTDRYGAEVADLVFARHRLKAYCERAEIPFVPFEDFDQVNGKITGWLDGTEPVPSRDAIGRLNSPCPISDSLAAGRNEPSAAFTTRLATGHSTARLEPSYVPLHGSGPR